MRNKANPVVELIAMRATGEITDDEFEQAKRLLEQGVAGAAPQNFVAQATPKEPRKGSVLVGLLVLIGFSALVGFIMMNVGKTDSAANATDGTQCFSRWNGSVPNLVDRVKENLRDPASFEHIKTTYGAYPPGFLTIAMDYRAKNGFGGYSVEQASALIGKTDCALSLVEM